MTDLSDQKRAARAAAIANRDAAHARGAGAARRAAAHMLHEIAQLRARGTVAAYLPIRSELDTRPLLLSLQGFGVRLAMPVVEGAGKPLRFRVWTPETPLAQTAFGLQEPAEGEFVTPDLVVVPLLAFDSQGWRLGYGGGFYDRTLAALRAAGEVTAIGFGYAAQQVPAVPRGPHDARLDAVATEIGILRIA